MDSNLKKELYRVGTALALFVIVMLLPIDSWVEQPYNVYLEFVLFLVPYLIAGGGVLIKAVKGVARGNALDENFLMAVASLGAFAMVFFPDTDPHMAEGAAVMIFYQVGELFEDFAVGKSRKSIKAMMDIAPDYANVMRNGELMQVDPYEVEPGDEIVIKPGERVPLDGVVIEGTSEVDTAALTGESVPRALQAGDEIISGCINLNGVLTVRVSKAFDESTVSRILELVENAAEKKARTENFITRFARFYTPIVVGCAVLLAIVPPLLLSGAWGDWIFRSMCFLVVSCPCALVISVPLSFFGGIGGVSKLGILVKGSNYMETLAQVQTVVFDKTGTLTTGSFSVTSVNVEAGFTAEELLELAACAEHYSDHPIAVSIMNAHGAEVDSARIAEPGEISGRGVHALVDGRRVHVGNLRLMEQVGLTVPALDAVGTIMYIAVDGVYAGSVVISDVVKPNAAPAIKDLYDAGVKRTVMLTGDLDQVASHVASELGISEYHAQLLPQDKVAHLEHYLEQGGDKSRVAFVGDGINDAPVLARADVGIAMGGIGSDAAVEAADVVIMDDEPSKIVDAICIARKTVGIVKQNIIFAIAIKIAVLILVALGYATMWAAVFGDVGVSVLAILNAIRALSYKK